MRSRSLRAAAVALLLVPALLAAQGPVGTVMFSVKSKLPDSLKKGMPIPDTVDVRMTAMSDGRRFAFEINLGAGMAAMMPGMDAMKLRIVYAPTQDSGHVGLILPAELVPMLGGVSGYRVDFPLTLFDSLTSNLSGLMAMVPATMLDSIKKATSTNMPAMRSLGTRSTVAGMECENWAIAVAADTMLQCVIPTPPALQQFQDKWMNSALVQALMKAVPGAAEARANAYGGRRMTMVQMMMPKVGMTMQLVSFLSGTPAASNFDLPADLKPVPLPAMPKLPGGSGGQ